MEGEVMIEFPSTGENSVEYKILNLEKEAEQISSTFNVVTDQINHLQVEQQKLKQKVLSIKNQIKGLLKHLAITSNPNKRKLPLDGFSQDHPNSFSQNTFQSTPASNPFISNNSTGVNNTNPLSSAKDTPMNIDINNSNNNSQSSESNEMMTDVSTDKQSAKEKIEIKPTITNNNTNLSVLPDTNPKLFSIEIKDDGLLQKLDYLLFEKNWRSEPTNQFFLHATSVIKSYLESYLPSIPSTHSTFVLKLSNQREKELSTNNLVQIKDVYLIYHKGLCFSENKVNIDNLQFWHEKKLKTSTMIGNVQLWSTTVRSRVEDKSNQLFGFISSRRVAHLPSSPLWLLYYFPKNMWQNSTAKSSPSHATNFVSPPHSNTSSARASPPHYPHSYLGYNSSSARDQSFEPSNTNNSLFSKKNNNPSLALNNTNNNTNNTTNIGSMNVNNNNTIGSMSVTNNNNNNSNNAMTFGDFASQSNNINLNISHDFKNRMGNPIPSPSLTTSAFNKFLKHSKGELDTPTAFSCLHQSGGDDKHNDLFSSSNHYYNDNSTPFSPMTNLLDYHPNNQIDFLFNSWDDRENSLYNFEGFGVSSIGQDFAHYAIAESSLSQDLFIKFNKSVNTSSGKMKENKDRIGERGGVIGVVGRNEKGRLLYTHNTEDPRCTHLTVTSPKYGFMSGRGNEEDGIGTADIGVIVVGVQLQWNEKQQKGLPKACSEIEPGKHVLVASGLGDFLAVSIPMSELNSVTLKSVVAVPLQSSSQFRPDENGVIWVSAFVHSTPSWLLSFLSPQPSQNNTDDIAKMIEIYCAKEMEAKYQNYSKTLADQLAQLHLSTHQKIIEESKINVENQVKLLTSSLFSNSPPSVNTPSSENLSARLSAIEKMINSELVKCIGDLSLSIKQSPSLNLSSENNRPILSEEEMKENQKIIESNYRIALQEFSDWKKTIDLSLTSIGTLKKVEIKEIEKTKEKLRKGIEFSHSHSLFLYSEILILSELDIRKHLPFINQVLKLYGYESNFLNTSFANLKENENLSSNNNNILIDSKENGNNDINKLEIKEGCENKPQEEKSGIDIEKEKSENDGKVFLICGLIEFRIGNYENAIKFFKKSASAEYEESYYYLAECYYHSFGVPQNIKKAKRFYSKLSFNSELPQASAALGLIYYFGIGEELPNYFESEKLFQFAVNNSAQSNSDALYFLGMIKLQQKDYQFALIHLNMSADKLNAKAQYQLALLYYEGNQFIPKNNQKAKKFLKLSAEQKYLPSFFALSSLFS